MSSSKNYTMQSCHPTCIDDLITQYDSLSVSSSETDNITLDSGIYLDSKSELFKQPLSFNVPTSKHANVLPPPPPPYNSTHNIISGTLDSSDIEIPFHIKVSNNSVSDNNSNYDKCSDIDVSLNSHLKASSSSFNNSFYLSKLLTMEKPLRKMTFENVHTTDQPESLPFKDIRSNLEPIHRIPIPATLSQQETFNKTNNQLFRKYNRQFQNETRYIREQTEDIKILGTCNKCQSLVTDSESACIALGNLYHSNCFTCCHCSRSLRGKVFFKDQEKIYCENDYMVFGFHKNVKVCNACGHIVTETILEALGKDFHPRCFKCSICQKCLDGIPFTVDRNNNIYCILDYHNTFAPRCSICVQPIVPCKDSDDVVRVVINDRDFHVECYRCQNCLKSLSNESNCFVWTTDRTETSIKLLCRKCHVNEIRELSRLHQQ